ncbi:aspartate carbamoyltransferase catalytic subunit [Syntrophobacter fumaroxidans]|uniref:Aspartate carbamoyltransferase catalytic subunit n=1 Tax=Syntrophobacter fumaroxidans (strain DSM 10017 / MPOB) TaxID=335543 RepID=PYRB_SYNFM|nr:aspartate carbamoyltransferase catalytic subunit [Syntrophobacter fumaroxidans]A0LK21.1 RecName: Full=Aspartate carbamoyltransferase catalytic subunit; AltName: Full=Aspartate transcarbamylase; Short=ATCase [Syntrophobacter fumaroxidans MPOB]ABK17773.1 aspartate carbamoyltransferase [Syntrophobacter fumaroxidans MPOB]
MPFKRKDLLGLRELDVHEIEHILELAVSLKEINARPIKKVPTLRGKTVIHLFYEPSTRTRTSFDIAAKRLSADTYSITTAASSMVKGETLLDTVKNLEAMKPDVFVLRHTVSGTPHRIARHTTASVINAGDGMHEHPSQALLDMMTMLEHKKKLDGLTVAILGDIAHSRVARSNIWGLRKMGAKVILCGPITLIPPEAHTMGVEVSHKLGEIIPEADVIMVLRLQKERQQQMLLPSLREYSIYYGLTAEKLKKARRNVLIMHPGPLNRGVEISPDVADGPHSVILDQVTNGVAVRMALLYLLGQK